MSLEVACPNCQAVLRAPAEAAGRRVKCKKCEHRFQVPGAAPPGASVADSQFLSVIDSAPVPVAQPAAVRPSPVMAAVVVPAPAEAVPTVVIPAGVIPTVVVPAAAQPIAAPVSAPVVSASDPFAFDPKAASSDDEDEDDAPRTSRHRKQKSGGAGKILLIGGVVAIVFLVGAAGAATAVYYALKDTKAALTAPTMPEVVAVVPPAVNLSDGKVEKQAPLEPKTEPTSKGKEPTKGKSVRQGPRLNKDKPGTGSTIALGGGPIPKATAPAFQIPDPPGGAAKLIAPAREKLALEIPTAQIKGAVFGTKNPRSVAIYWSVFGGFQGSGAKDAIDVYSISTGRQIARFELSADGFTGSRAFDLSPDGTRLAVEQPVGKLTVYDVDRKEKLLDGIDPFEGAPPRSGPPAGFKFAGASDVLLVMDRAGAVDVWSIASKTRSAAGRPNGMAGGPTPVVADLVGETFWTFAQGSVNEVSPTTGDAGSAVTVMDAAGAPLGLGIDGTGRKGAAVYREPGTPGAHGLAVLDLRAGKYLVTDKLVLPEKAGAPNGVSLVGAGSVAAVQLQDRSACFIFDAEHNVPAFYIKAASGTAVKHFADADADRLWWVLPDTSDAKRSLMVSVEANFDGYQELVEMARTGKKPLYLIPRADGLAK